MSKSQIKNRFYLQIPYIYLQFEAKGTPTPSEAAVFNMNIDSLHSEPIFDRVYYDEQGPLSGIKISWSMFIWGGKNKYSLTSFCSSMCPRAQVQRR